MQYITQSTPFVNDVFRPNAEKHLPDDIADIILDLERTGTEDSFSNASSKFLS